MFFGYFLVWVPIFDPTLVQYFIQIPHIIFCCPLSAYDKWWFEQKKSPHFREKYLVLSYLKLSNFVAQTICCWWMCGFAWWSDWVFNTSHFTRLAPSTVNLPFLCIFLNDAQRELQKKKTVWFRARPWQKKKHCKIAVKLFVKLFINLEKSRFKARF